MRHLLLPFLLLLVSAGASAQGTKLLGDPVTVTWDHPTTYEDNSALPIGEIAHTALFLSQDLAQLDAGQMTLIQGPAATGDLTPPTVGTWYIGAKTVTITGVSSVMSNTAFIDVVASFPVPNPPTNLNLVAAAGVTASTITQTRDRIALVAVGTVSAAVPCDAAYSVNGQYVVPYDSVQWFGTVRSEVVVAPCTSG